MHAPAVVPTDVRRTHWPCEIRHHEVGHHMYGARRGVVRRPSLVRMVLANPRCRAGHGAVARKGKEGRGRARKGEEEARVWQMCGAAQWRTAVLECHVKECCVLGCTRPSTRQLATPR